MQGGASRERRAFLLGHVRAAFAGTGAHGAGNVGKCVWNLAPNLAARRAARGAGTSAHHTRAVPHEQGVTQ